MNLTKKYEHELYNDDNRISVVEVGYAYDSSSDDLCEAGNYVKVLDPPSVMLIIENERNEIAFYKSFSLPTGINHASLLVTPMFRENFTPVQMAMELADDGFGITLENPTLLTVNPLHFSEISDEKFYVVYGRCSGYNEEDGGSELFWIHEPNVMVRIEHQLAKGTPFALEREGAILNDLSIAALLIKKLYNKT